MFFSIFSDCENFVFYYDLPSSMNVIADNNSGKLPQMR